MQQTESMKAEQTFRRKERTLRFFLFSSLASLAIVGYILSWHLVLPS